MSRIKVFLSLQREYLKLITLQKVKYKLGKTQNLVKKV